MLKMILLAVALCATFTTATAQTTTATPVAATVFACPEPLKGEAFARVLRQEKFFKECQEYQRQGVLAEVAKKTLTDAISRNDFLNLTDAISGYRKFIGVVRPSVGTVQRDWVYADQSLKTKDRNDQFGRWLGQATEATKPFFDFDLLHRANVLEAKQMADITRRFEKLEESDRTKIPPTKKKP